MSEEDSSHAVDAKSGIHLRTRIFVSIFHESNLS